MDRSEQGKFWTLLRIWPIRSGPRFCSRRFKEDLLVLGYDEVVDASSHQKQKTAKRANKVLSERIEMPIYEYQCKKCGAVSEFLIRVEAEQGVACQTCGSPEVQRLISAPAFLNAAGKQEAVRTCCGSAERCEIPPCSSEGTCRRA